MYLKTVINLYITQKKQYSRKHNELKCDIAHTIYVQAGVAKQNTFAIILI